MWENPHRCRHIGPYQRKAHERKGTDTHTEAPKGSGESHVLCSAVLCADAKPLDSGRSGQVPSKGSKYPCKCPPRNLARCPSWQRGLVARATHTFAGKCLIRPPREKSSLGRSGPCSRGLCRNQSSICVSPGTIADLQASVRITTGWEGRAVNHGRSPR